MQPSAYFLDSNLLVLLVVGFVDRKYIPKYKRTQQYSVEDYEKLCKILDSAKQIFVTPNILTETSNLVCDDKRMADILRELIRSSCVEVYVGSRTAVERNEFKWLGLTDCALLAAVTPEAPLLTADFDLTRAARNLDPNIVEHIRPSSL